ncbi:TonB-dependent receptor [Terrimonas sp. NA20]|uniref:TonB-dependent receptor n=1 Tax=Terrimonas ginsenosidimutans TaxID=2908004 RepID=A0ABS9KL42_9BACT|nr:outer membrane beta-barrel protein [Terrimonas ginsenosidimutans]MCG2613045.1 TonB-dependent receptor [Terrimonas ginsenosidimutans]
MKKLLILCVALVHCLLSLAQSSKGTISFTIKDQRGHALENMTVEVLKKSDSTLMKTAFSGKDGYAEINNLNLGTYMIRVTGIGYTHFYSNTIELTSANASIQLPAILMTNQTAEMSAVTVTAKKPFIQKLSDRIVVNVESSIIGAGSSAMDVLERSPGVNIDQNDVISLRGRSGLIIMIDGKPTPMTGADLANYLRGLPSGAIDRIDIITNPSAKYDAAGNAGIIDIRLKKDQRKGMNGTLTAGYGQGVYPKANGGVVFNYRDKAVNVFGNYNYAYRIVFNNLLLDRRFFNNGAYVGGDLKDNYGKTPINTHTARAGADFFLSKKTILGFVVNANFNQYSRDNRNSSIVLNSQAQKESTFNANATNDDNARNFVANINLKHSIDTTGQEISADLDYGSYNSNSLSLNSTSYSKLDGTPLQPNYILQGDQSGQLDFKIGKIDYVRPLNKTARIEAGMKTSFVSSDNDAKFFDVSSGSPVNDVNKTNHFLYKENNNAGYVNFSKTFKKFDLQLGLRGEHTNLKTQQLSGNIKFDSSYFQLFPSAFFNYKLKENQVLGISVSRRIDRPGYSQLNPFLFLIDVTTYATGRPGLLPQLTWSYEMSYTLKNLSFTANYSHTKNHQDIAIARFKDVFPSVPSDDNVTVQIPINLSSSDYYGLNISAPVRINAWWNMVNDGNFYYNQFNGQLGVTRLNRGRPAASIRNNNMFTFKKGWSAELSGTWNSAGQSGFMVFDPRWNLSAGVQKTILKGKGTLRANVSDIFWTDLPQAVITYDNYIEKWKAYRETRVANLTFSYRFGNNKVQAARRRATASEEERRRAN